MNRKIDFGDCVFIKSETKEFMTNFLGKWDISNLFCVKFKKKKASDSEFKKLNRIAKTGEGIRKYFSIFCYLPETQDREKVKFRKRGEMYSYTKKNFKEYFAPGIEIPKIKDMHIDVGNEEAEHFFQGRLMHTVNIDGSIEAIYGLFRANRVVWDTEKFKTIDEIAVWLFAREIYNFLFITKQIAGEAKLERAFEFGVNVLREYRIYMKEFFDYLKRRKRFVSTIITPRLADRVAAAPTIDSQINRKVILNKFPNYHPTNKKIKECEENGTIAKVLLKYHKDLVGFASQGYICYKCKIQFSPSQSVEWIDKREGTFECPKCREVLKVY